ncbi:MAG: glucose-1-phosphate adenylyltransferase [Anaerolineae bacterium]|nr:glucose-1-phosphate adenylyltransferase [Anaerolineae bacterium]
MPSLNDILAVILGGGRGTRLFPLTQQRSKPAVPIAGKYRLIDIPLSNCINSGIYRVAVLTQFNSVSLHRHISRTYQFDAFHLGWVQIWAAEQTMENTDWYQGTADAVRKQMFEIRSTGAKYVLVLAGDHLYRMDYSQMAAFHWENNADITVAVQPVAASDAARFGILKRNSNHRIISFAEKPRDPDVLASLVSRDDPERPYLGSMGIYMFRTEVLFDLLNDRNFQDFGAHVIPQAIQSHTVYGFDFDDYWEDIGTIRSFYDTNLMLTLLNSPFNFYDAENPIYTSARYLPGSIVERSVLENVLLAEGCRIMDSHIRHSVVGVRSQIRSGVELVDSILMGSDYYDRTSKTWEASEIPMGIGSNSFIQGAIIDKNASVGKNVVIRPFPRGVDLDGGNWFVRDGIVVIPKNAVLEDGLQIGPET